MDFVANARDTDDAVEIFATGISRISRIGRGTVRITFCSDRQYGPRDFRDFDALVVAHIVMDLEAFTDALLKAGGSLKVVIEEPTPAVAASVAAGAGGELH